MKFRAGPFFMCFYFFFVFFVPHISLSLIFVPLTWRGFFMVFLFSIFLFFLALMFLLYYHHSSPYKLYVLFGKKGAGKSTLMVQQMLKYQKKGWTIYTDMEDTLIDHVRIFKTLDLATFIPDRNSLVCLDEAGLSFDNRNFKSFPSGLRDFFALQRKYKVVVIVNSQSYDLDKKIRDRADKLFLLTNFGRLSLIRPIYRSITLTEASSMGESRVADQLRFALPFSWKFLWLPKYYKYFSSFNAPYRDSIPYDEVLTPDRFLWDAFE